VVGSERDMSHPGGDRRPSAYPAYPGPAESARPTRPPLTKRMRPIHWIAIDCVVGAVLALGGAATIAGSLHGQARLPLVLLFMVVVFIPVALRRRAPVIAFGALVIVGVLLARLPPAVPAAVFLDAAFALFTVTVESRRRTGAAALGLMLAIMVTLTATSSNMRPRGETAGEFVPVALANVLAWITGYSVRQRRLYVVTLQYQAANSAVAEERLRIARELHDVVAHSMSVIAVQAGYGQYVIDSSPDGAKDALGAIQATSRDALEEMRRMLGVLRQQDAASSPARIDPAAGQAPPDGGVPPRQAPLGPAPGLAGLERLVTRTRGAGVRVRVEVSGQARSAPAGVDLSAYRIIQEALTNVVRHAGTGSTCVVSLGYTDSDLVIRVTDNGGLPAAFPPASVAAPGTGHGIIGMRERVHLCGGTFGAGPLPQGGFQVTAALPLPSAGFRAEGRPGTEGGSDVAAAAAAVSLPAQAPAADSLAQGDGFPHGAGGAGDGFPHGAGNGDPAPMGARAADGGGRG
jgi:signal transduction histidine kinase